MTNYSALSLREKYINKPLNREIYRNRSIYMLLIPAVFYFSLFHYIPMFNGIIISMKDYSFSGNSTFVGAKHYKEILIDMDFWYSFRNTLIIGIGSIALSFFTQILLALLLNEVMVTKFKKAVQTIIYTPYLFSWVAIGGIWISLLSPDGGMVNTILSFFGFKTIHFMTDEKLITPIFWLLYTWRSAGYGCVIFLAALAGIDPNLYEAARIDGANRFRQTLAITIPSLYSTMNVVFMLNLISSLRMFSQAYILSNPMVIDKTEVAMTYTYKMGLQNFRMDYASAVAFFMLVMIAGLTSLYKMLTSYSDRK
jgi:putative aldouronate transport system permease protein